MHAWGLFLIMTVQLVDSSVNCSELIQRWKIMKRFERRHEKLAPTPIFIRRVVESLLMTGMLIGFSLIIGIAGYHWLAGLGWVDALLDASMILGGMGPVSELHTTEAKLFASLYALFSGMVFIGIIGLVLAPLAHRMLHRFHLDDEDLQKSERGKK